MAKFFHSDLSIREPYVLPIDLQSVYCFISHLLFSTFKIYTYKSFIASSTQAIAQNKLPDFYTFTIRGGKHA